MNEESRVESPSILISIKIFRSLIYFSSIHALTQSKENQEKARMKKIIIRKYSHRYLIYVKRKSRVTISVRYFFSSRMIRWTFKITKLVLFMRHFYYKLSTVRFSKQLIHFMSGYSMQRSRINFNTFTARHPGLFVSLLARTRFFLCKSFLSSLRHSVMFPFKFFFFFIYFVISSFFTTLTICKHLFYFAIIFVWVGHYHDLQQSKSQLL